jgi:hypothetical protein
LRVIKVIKYLFCVLALFLFLFSCISNDSSVLDALSNKEKSDILTKKGIALYQEKIEKNNDYSAETKDEVKKYFTMALSFNKDNKTATDYITKIDSLAKIGYEKMYNIAVTYKDVKKKSEADEFYMCFYLEKALVIDPANEKGLKLKKEINKTYEKLVKLYINRGTEIKNKINSSRVQSEKDKLFIAGYDNFFKATLIDGSNSGFKSELSFFENQIAEMMKTAVTALYNKIKIKQFDAAANALSALDQNNAKVHKRFAREILDIKFQLYRDWAVDLYGKKNLKLALYKIDAALSIKNDNYLSDLKNKISDSITSDSFDSILADIDALIFSGDLYAAKGKIDYLKNSTKDAANKQELAKRAQLILAKIPDLYQAAVDEYNAENIKEAINMFDAINKLRPNYLDTNSYLEKAIKIQKILDNS